MNKKILSLLLAAFMIVGILAPMGALAEGETTTIVHIHKILMSKEAMGNHNPDKVYDPAAGITSIADFFGDTQAKEIDNVYFVALKADDSLDNYKIESGKYVNKTDSTNVPPQGLTTPTGLDLTLGEGSWKIYEIKELSTYVGADDKLLADSLAVPVEITLPLKGPDGNMPEVHVYPKNTEDGPPVDKDVTNVGNKDDSFDFDTPQTWIITNTVPAGIADYVAYKFTDAIDSRLTYQQDTVKIYIDNVEVASTEITNTEGTADKIYVDQPSATNGQKLTVDFKDYVSKLTAGKAIRIEYKTVINDTAIMGQDIPNEVNLEFGNNPDNIKEKKPENPPKVYTGGKKFKKIGEGDDLEKLPGAEFVVTRTADGGTGNKEYLVTNADGKREWKEFADKETAYKDPNIVKLVSGADGTFEIKGLKYGDTGTVNDVNASKDYYLEEVKAPKGYALKSGQIKFTVNKTSYFTNPDEVSHTPADPQVVNNTKITIPQTGGVGTIIFTVVGLAIMSVAVISLKKRRNEH